MQSALLAAGYLQDCAPRIIYGLHQFMGAMVRRSSIRSTIEPTARLLVSDLGGASPTR